MSTKTTFKRVALVAVAALAGGLLTVVSTPVASAAAASLSVDSASVTVVQKNAYAAKATDMVAAGAGAFALSVMDNSTTPVATRLGNSETITATVIGFPAQSGASGSTVPSASDLSFTNVKNRTLLTPDTGTGGTIVKTTNDCVVPLALDDTTTTTEGVYCVAVVPNANIAGWGTYTIAFDLLDANRNVLQRVTAKYTLVSSAATSGALLTISKAGSIVVGETYSPTDTKYIRAALTDANGGRLVNNDTATAAATSPSLSATLESSTGTVLNTLTALDTGTTAGGESTSAVANDGAYGLVPSAAVGALSTTTAGAIRVRYGLLNVTSSAIALPTASAVASASLRAVDGTGLYTATETSTASGAISYSVPLTTTTATVTFVLKSASATLQNEPITIYTTWTGVNAGSVTPASGVTKAVVYRSDADGVVNYTITQAAPLNGSTATVYASGAASGTYGALTFTWGVPTVTAANASVDAASFKSVAASATKFGITVKDQFKNPMAGIVVQPSVGALDANYSTTAMAPITTDANGYASVTLTGGAASTTVTDTVTFKWGTTTLGTSKATYVAALPVIATITGAWGEQNATEYPNVFTTTALGATAPKAVSIITNYSNTIDVTGSANTDTQVEMQVTVKDAAGAVVTGVPVTITTTSGAHFTDSCSGGAGKPVQTKVCYPTSTGLITINTIATGTGTQTWTFTAGAVSAKQSMSVKNVVADARTIAVSASGQEVTAKVTDRFGNGVSGAAVQFNTTVGTLGNGQKTNSYTTDASGNVVIALDLDGSSTVTATLTASSGDHLSIAGYSGAYPIGAVAAGVSTASMSVTGTQSLATISQAGVDAAAEATDAANAATDAANAAAEAADAATAAAQDAADAVAALSAQMATLIAGLKAQMTALTNLVIKIQKKVKA